jgi:hypothetical protein
LLNSEQSASLGHAAPSFGASPFAFALHYEITAKTDRTLKIGRWLTGMCGFVSFVSRFVVSPGDPGFTSSITRGTVSGMSSGTGGEKMRENRLRRMADRQGLRLLKSRARDPLALTFGCYGLVDNRTNFLVQVDDPVGRGFPFDDLDEVEQWLSTPRR